MICKRSTIGYGQNQTFQYIKNCCKFESGKLDILVIDPNTGRLLNCMLCVSVCKFTENIVGTEVYEESVNIPVSDRLFWDCKDCQYSKKNKNVSKLCLRYKFSKE